jgi:hypothetical protein
MLPSPAQHNVLVSLMNEDNEVTNTHHLCLMIYDKGLQVMKVACGVVKKREKSSMVDRCFGSDQP